MSAPVRFGILGAARITPAALIYASEGLNDVQLTCVAARNRSRAEAFAAEHRIGAVLEDYAAVVHAAVDAIYLPLPISTHEAWTLEALAAGRHVLCEKAIANNAIEARRMADAAHAADRVLMEAFHYRYHPLFDRVLSLIADGAVGALRRVDGHFSVPHIHDGDIRLDYATGGGALMDLGCYCVHWFRHVTGAEPVVRRAEARLGPPEVDLVMDAELSCADSGVEGRVHCSMDPQEPMRAELRIEGERGTLTVINPLAPQMGHELRLANGEGELREQVDRTPSYRYQLEAFVAAVRGDAEANLTDGEDAVRNMTVIDAIYDAAGLRRRGT